ncbi:hypothetical protein D9M73_203200 [compost metagenome]
MPRAAEQRILRELAVQGLGGLFLLEGSECATGLAEQAAQALAGVGSGADHEEIRLPGRAAVGLALEPESSRWRLQEALRLSVRRTCTPAPTCNPRGCIYRLRDITDWPTHQGAGGEYTPRTVAETAARRPGCVK